MVLKEQEDQLEYQVRMLEERQEQQMETHHHLSVELQNIIQHLYGLDLTVKQMETMVEMQIQEFVRDYIKV